MTHTLEDVSIPAPPPSDLDWNEDGFVIRPGLLPDHVIDRYCDEWRSVHLGITGWQHARKGGWPNPTPYMQNPALRALSLYPAVMEQIQDLLGEPGGLHLNLTGWVSTERDWHQDTYLNPAHVGPYYVAVWMALDDIKPDSGPFQMVAGSHRWCEVTQDKTWAIMADEHRHPDHWPTYSEQYLTPIFEREIEARQAPIIDYLPKRGDVLFWHGRLLHRGSKATAPGTERRALICHYSGINHRQDMPTPVPEPAHPAYYFPIDTSDGKQSVRP